MAHNRIGLIVPSSNVTVETEIPRLLARTDTASFSFHSSRMRMHAVSVEELRAMNAQRERCVFEVADARVDAVLYACLVAVMVSGPGAHRDVELAVTDQLAAGAAETKVLSSAGALIRALGDLRARRVALVMPYLEPLAREVVRYVEAEGFEVPAWVALGVGDNHDVGCIAPATIMTAARGLDLTGIDALVLSCCVQMPSLDIVEAAEDEFGIPVLSAATAGAYALLRDLGLPVDRPGAGSLLRADAALTSL